MKTKIADCVFITFFKKVTNISRYGFNALVTFLKHFEKRSKCFKNDLTLVPLITLLYCSVEDVLANDQ